jgi:hypothetical protein
MSQVRLVVDVLKKALRSKGLTYADAAKVFRLSESSVKRLFARGDFTLARIEALCDLLDMEMTGLLELMRAAEGRLTELTEQQERELVSDPKLLLVGILATNHWSMKNMLETYRFSEPELVRLLARLDKLNIIELRPGNRIKVRLARNFAWRKGGPFQRFFADKVQKEFLLSSFQAPGELRILVHGSISTRANALIQQRLKKVAEEFDALVDEDRRINRDLREGNTLLMAIRPWELNTFTNLRRRPLAAVSPSNTSKAPSAS